MVEMNLYHYYRSSCSWRVRWALILKDMDFNLNEVHLLKKQQSEPEYVRLSATGLVPTLVVDGVAYSDSMAILEWLEEKVPSPALLPTAPSDRLRVRQMANTIASGIQPLQNLGVIRKHSRFESEQRSFARYWIEKRLSAVETLVSRYGGRYCYGAEISFADLCLVPQIYNAARFDVDLDKFPSLMNIYEFCRRLDSCQKSAPEFFTS